MNLYDILMAENVEENLNNNKEKLIEIIPEIEMMIGFDHHHPHHHKDVWEHTVLALSKSECIFEVRLALLLHDIGKTVSYQIEKTKNDGYVLHYKDHPQLSAGIAYEVLSRLNYKEEFIKKICSYILKHDTRITDKDIEDSYDDALTLYKIQKCDALSHHPDKLERRIDYLKTTAQKLGIEYEQQDKKHRK